MADELLTVPEAANRLKVSTETVRRWLRDGVLTGAKVGKRQWRVRASELERLSPPMRGKA